jgi:hypothetical protein
VGLGKTFRPTVRSNIIFCQYSTGKDKKSSGKAPENEVNTGLQNQPEYYPVLDIMYRTLMKDESYRLKIFQGDGGMLMYELGGRVLRAALPIPRTTDMVDRRTTDKETLFREMKEFSRRVIPPTVEDAISDRTKLDLEIHLNHKPAADLPWEYLHIISADYQFALMNQHTITRFITGKHAPGLPRYDRKPRILIAPVFSQEEMDNYGASLKLRQIKDEMREHGIEVLILHQGASTDEIVEKLKTWKPDIFQWIGHGGPDTRDGYNDVTAIDAPQGQTLLDRIQFRQLFADVTRPPRVVILTSCRLGAELVEFGVPRNLVWDGAGAVVSFRDPVSFANAGIFSSSFYGAIAQGSSVREAVAAARRDLYDANKEEGDHPGSFGAPILTCSHAEGLQPLVYTGNANQDQAEAPTATPSMAQSETAATGSGPDFSVWSDPGDGELPLD